MRRNWWFVWVEVAVLAIALLFAYRFATAKVDALLSPYLSDEDIAVSTEEIESEEDANIVDVVMSKVERFLGKKLNYEDLIFDFANDFAENMMHQSAEERNAVSEPLS